MALDPKLARSRRQERDTAETYGGKRTAGSGNQWRAKGDVRTGRYLIENKRTDNTAGITLKFADLRKIEAEALAASRLPLLVFQINGRNYVVQPEDDWVAEHE